MSARYPYYLLADSPEGRRKEQEVSGQPQPLAAAQGDIRQGFVYERAPHVTLKSIANNAEIDVIYERWQAVLEPLRAALNSSLLPLAGEGGPTKSGRMREVQNEAETSEPASQRPHPSSLRDDTFSRKREKEEPPFEDWQIPREAGADWPAEAKNAHAKWWEGRIARQREIDASIAKAADVELLYDRPYEDKARVRVAGPFTVESLSPHRVVPADAAALFNEADELLQDEKDKRAPRAAGSAEPTDFAAMILDNLRAADVHSTEKRDAITLPRSRPGPAPRASAPRGAFWKARARPPPSAAPRSSLGRSSARSVAATLSPPHARRRRRASTC